MDWGWDNSHLQTEDGDGFAYMFLCIIQVERISIVDKQLTVLLSIANR